MCLVSLTQLYGEMTKYTAWLLCFVDFARSDRQFVCPHCCSGDMSRTMSEPRFKLIQIDNEAALTAVTSQIEKWVACFPNSCCEPFVAHHAWMFPESSINLVVEKA